MTTACSPVDLTEVATPVPQLGFAGLRRYWAAWRERAARRAEWRALEELSESTRRDIGLAERAPLAPSQALWHHERGLW